MTEAPDFYSIVRIKDTEGELSQYNGFLGVIIGISDEGSDPMTYAVYVRSSQETCCFLRENLVSTGEYADPSEIESGETIKVLVDEKGRGSLG